MERVRYVVVVAVAGLSVTMGVTFAWAIAETIRLIGVLLDGGWRSELSMVDLLEVIDTYLLAIVQLIVVIGLYELFIGALDVPDWLEGRNSSTYCGAAGSVTVGERTEHLCDLMAGLERVP